MTAFYEDRRRQANGAGLESSVVGHNPTAYDYLILGELLSN